MFWNLLEEGTKEPQGTPWTSYVLIGVIVLALVGMFVWQTISGKKKQKQAQEMLSGIKVGDRVKTIGGICGFVAEVRDSDNTFVLETGLDGKTCFIRFDKGAVYQTSPEGNANAPQPEKVEEAPVKEQAEKQAPAKSKKAKKEKVEVKEEVKVEEVQPEEVPAEPFEEEK